MSPQMRVAGKSLPYWNGKVGDHYLGLIEVQRTDTESLMKEIERFLIAKGIRVENAMFVGFNGCNTMSGQNKGNK